MPQTLQVFLDISIILFLVFLFFGFVPLFEIVKNYFKDKKAPPPDKVTVFYQIGLPLENNASLEEMQMFFSAASSIRKQDGNNSFTFEIHSDGGKISFYLITSEGVYPTIRSSLEARYPGTSFTKIQDPFTDIRFVNTWALNSKESNQFKEFKSLELGYTPITIEKENFAPDLMPSLNWRAIQNGVNPPTNDPINQIIAALEEIKESEYAVFQLILKPEVPKREEWKTSFEKVRTLLATNANVDGTNAITDEEKLVLNEMGKKVNAECYNTKIRFAYFTKDTEIVSNINWETIPLTFLQQFKTAYQTFQVKTPYDGHQLGFKYLNKVEMKKVTADIFESKYSLKESDKEGAYKKIINKNHGIESEFRKKQQYIALIKRDLEIGSKPIFMDLESLACIFHFPTTHNKANVTSKLQELADQNPDSNSSWGLAPSNLPF
jgi:hypothetical protein